MKPKPQIVDRGRGPQFAHRNMTLLNLVPLFRENQTTEEILHHYSLEADDVEVAREYYVAHREDMDRWDREADGYFDEQRKKMEERFPPAPVDSTLEERVARLRRQIALSRASANGH